MYSHSDYLVYYGAWQAINQEITKACSYFLSLVEERDRI